MLIFKSNIVGNGFIASKFKKHQKFLKKNKLYVYASGVSNSQLKEKSQFKKDYNKLKNFLKKINNNQIIYISSYAVFDPNRKNSNYIKNKLKIESYIKKNHKNYKIIRLPEIVGKSKNKNTLVNFFINSIVTNKKLKIFKNAKRNLLDIDDAVKLVMFFLKNKSKLKEINIINKYFYSPLQIATTLLKIKNKKNKFLIIKSKYENWKIKNSLNEKILRYNHINFKKNYLIKILKKYY